MENLSPLPLSVTANNYTILRLFPLQQSLDIIINVLRRICNPVAGGWMVVGDLYDGRPRSLSRLAAGTASALSMTKPITLQSSSKAMFYGLLTVTVCLLHAGDAFSCIFKRPVILSILSWQGAAVLPLAETRWRLNGPPLSCKIMKSWSWWIFWSQCNALLDPAAAFTSILNAIGRQYEKK